MKVHADQAVTIDFRVKDSDGQLVDADELPTLTLYRNGAATSVVVTPTTIPGLGRYSASWTNPGYADYDQLRLEAATLIGGEPFVSVVWEGYVEPPSLPGPLAKPVTFTATGEDHPVSGVLVDIVDRRLVTGTDGMVTIFLDPGSYTAVLVAPSGFLPLDPIEVTVTSEPVVVPITLTPIGYPAEDAPFSNVLFPVINGYGQGVVGVVINLEFLGFDAGATPPAVVIPPLEPLTTGVHGLTNAKLLRFGRYRANYSYNGRTKVREFVVPDSGTFQVVEPI